MTWRMAIPRACALAVTLAVLGGMATIEEHERHAAGERAQRAAEYQAVLDADAHKWHVQRLKELKVEHDAWAEMNANCLARGASQALCDYNYPVPQEPAP